MKQATQTPTDTSRLFLALWPDDAIRLALQANRGQWVWPPQVWLAHENSLHLTLHFLGNFPSLRIPELLKGLRIPFRAFDLCVNEPRVWPNGIAVLKPAPVPDGLLQLHASLGESLQGMDIPVESRAYRPHITFARRAKGASPPPECPAISWPVRSYALMQSMAAPARGYKILQSYPGNL